MRRTQKVAKPFSERRSIIESVYHFIATFNPHGGLIEEMIVSETPTPLLMAVIHLKVEIELINFAIEMLVHIDFSFESTNIRAITCDLQA